MCGQWVWARELRGKRKRGMEKWKGRESEKAWTGKSTENRLTERWRVNGHERQEETENDIPKVMAQGPRWLIYYDFSFPVHTRKA